MMTMSGIGKFRLEPIRYLPISDLAVPYYMDKAKSQLSQVIEKDFSPDINDIVSIFNILRYMSDGLEQRLDNPDRKSLTYVIIEFCKLVTPNDMLTHFNQLSRWLDDDFWEFFVSYKLERNLSEDEFCRFLTSEEPNIRPILLQKPLCKKFRKSLRDYFLSNIKNVCYLIERKEIQRTPSPVIPIDVTFDDELSLISRYIESESPSFGYLEIFGQSKEIPSRMRLAAQRRAEVVRTQVVKSAAIFDFGVEVSYREQDDAVEVELKGGIAKFFYDINWIRSNSDNATLLNNFIHLFNYIDDQSRLTLCFQMSELGVMERTMLKQRVDWHPEGVAFAQKNQAALLQLHSYSKVLVSIDSSIEELINWFFSDYTKTEFGIHDFQADLPEGERPFVEKCKLLAPEIERVLRQFQLLVEDGQIDHDLIALETNPFSPAYTKSFLERKYCYINSDDGERATYYFYSDQCMLNYDSRSQKSYETFANRLAQQKPCSDDFEEYQDADLNWLEEKGYLQFDSGVLVEVNVDEINFLGEIFRNGCLCYDDYNGNLKKALDVMISQGTLRVESSLFSEPEGKYIDYHLNKRSFINSLDLRNKYAHGSHLGLKGDDRVHELNYLQLLKIMICIVLKINDELCRRSDTKIE